MTSKRKVKELIIEHVKDEKAKQAMIEYINNLTTSYSDVIQYNKHLKSTNNSLVKKGYTPRVSKRAFQ